MKRRHFTPSIAAILLIQACSPSPWVAPPAIAPAAQPSARVVPPTAEGPFRADRTASEQARASHAVAGLRRFTNLDAREQERVSRAEALLERGEAGAALRLAEALAAEFSAAFRAYRTASGETLQRIAARDDTFANARLWPLLAQRNPEVSGPQVALPAQTLIRIPLHPTIEEISAALARSR